MIGIGSCDFQKTVRGFGGPRTYLQGYQQIADLAIVSYILMCWILRETLRFLILQAERISIL